MRPLWVLGTENFSLSWQVNYCGKQWKLGKSKAMVFLSFFLKHRVFCISNSILHWLMWAIWFKQYFINNCTKFTNYIKVLMRSLFLNKPLTQVMKSEHVQTCTRSTLYTIPFFPQFSQNKSNSFFLPPHICKRIPNVVVSPGVLWADVTVLCMQVKLVLLLCPRFMNRRVQSIYWGTNTHGNRWLSMWWCHLTAVLTFLKLLNFWKIT